MSNVFKANGFRSYDHKQRQKHFKNESHWHYSLPGIQTPLNHSTLTCTCQVVFKVYMVPVFVEICKTVQTKFGNVVAFEGIKAMKNFDITAIDIVTIQYMCTINISFHVLNFIYKSSYLVFTLYKTALLAMI